MTFNERDAYKRKNEHGKIIAQDLYPTRTTATVARWHARHQRPVLQTKAPRLHSRGLLNAQVLDSNSVTVMHTSTKEVLGNGLQMRGCPVSCSNCDCKIDGANKGGTDTISKLEELAHGLPWRLLQQEASQFIQWCGQ